MNGPTLAVTVRTDEEALSTLSVEWRSLWDADPQASIFHTPEYAQAAWFTELGADRDFLSVEVRRQGALTGLVTLGIEADRTLRFLGNSNVTDYLGPLAVPADREGVASAFIGAIAELDTWRAAELECLAAGSGWPDLLTRAAKEQGFDVTQTQQDVCPRVAIPGSFDAYLESLNGKLRHELKRKARRLEREAGPYVIRLSDSGSLDRDLDIFFEMHLSSEGHKGKFMHEGMRVFFRRLATGFDARGWLRLAWLEIGGEPWAAIMSFSERGITSVYNSAFDHTKRELGPGMVLVGETIRMAAEEGCHTYDFLRGDESYKYRFGAVDEPIVHLSIHRT